MFHAQFDTGSTHLLTFGLGMMYSCRDPGNQFCFGNATDITENRFASKGRLGCIVKTLI